MRVHPVHVALALALALAGGCLMAATAVRSASAGPVDEQAAATVPGPVVVVGVPDLRWQDVDPALTPTLWRLVGRSSIAAMTDRSGEDVARRATGWLTLNTGTRARANVGPGTVPDPAAPSQLRALRAANRSAPYDAQIGALGDALHRAGLAVAAVGGPGAVLGAMAGDGTVDSRAPSVAAAPGQADVVVVELPQLYEVGRHDAGAVHDALATIDNGVGTILQALPTNGSLLVAGVSEAAGGPAHLHVAMATGPSFGPGRLTSASTGRAGVVQLIDVAPTVLWLTGTPVPSGMLGVHWRAVPGTGASAAQQVAALVELDRRSVTELAAVHWYYPAVAWTAFLYVTATVIAWTRRRVRILRPLGAVVASVPVASYLVQMVPWWRAGSWPLAPLTLGLAAAVGSAATLGPLARRNRWHTAAFVGAVTAAVIVADAATGSPLSLDAPFADNPIVAGRFHGIGNVAFALLGAGTLILAAAVATALRPRRAAAAVFGVGAAAVAVDGLPALGDDFGGVLALLPAVAVLGLVVSKVRISGGHALAVLVATVMTTAGFALYDYSRPPLQRTHLGRFIGQIADGSAGSVVARKLDSSLATFTDGWPRLVVVGWLVLALAAYVGHRQGSLRVAAAVDRRTAAGLLAALLVLAVLGAGLNDSGLEITAFTFYLAAPLLVPMVEPVPKPLGTSPPHREVGSPGYSRS
jgi:hypothetical protein